MAIQRTSSAEFRLDATNESLWHGLTEIHLRPKAFAVLKYLVEHRGQLVTKQQFLEAVWPGTFVTDAVLKDSIRQLREALGDAAESPRYIETAHRRGYRFIGRISTEPISTTVPALPLPGAQPWSAGLPPSPVGVLGRDDELRKMSGWLERALAGEPQTVFVTGEPGIGKTTLVNALVEQASRVPNVLTARGQCIEHFGAGEAYLPVLDAISRLARTPPGGARIIDVLRQHASAWLLQLPSLLQASERDALKAGAAGATQERMLREMAGALEAITAESPLVLVLEDLHWSDYSTLDLIAFLARRRETARLMVIGTYRPVDVILADHPLKDLKRELHAHNLCRELPLEYLTEEVVAQFLAARFAGGHLPARLARLIHRRTEGNPLFMVNLVEYLVDERIIVEADDGWQLRGGWAEIESGIPENVRELIEKQIDRLAADERKVLEGASVVGMECSSVAIGAGLDEPTEWVEARCEALVRRHRFLSPARIVELPDGTITPRYKFAHILYLEVPYRLLPAMRRRQIHLRIGQTGESIYGDRVSAIAAELAMHFEQGLDHPRAVKYLLMAAENATHRGARHEAEALARRGLQALATLPASPHSQRQELSLLMILGLALMSIDGFAATEVKDVYRRALEICGPLGALSQAFRAQWLLGLCHYFRAELQPAREIAEQLVERAHTLEETVFRVEAECGLGATLLELGRLRESVVHLDKVVALRERHREHRPASFSGRDPEVVAECFRARALWMLGYPDQALNNVERALTLARTLSDPESIIVATYFASHIHLLRGEFGLAQERAESAATAAEEFGLAVWSAVATMNRGWARAAQGHDEEGAQEIRRGLTAYETTGATLWRPHFLGILAQALAAARRVDEGLNVIGDALALVNDTGEHWSTAELQRIRGELLLARTAGPRDDEATRCFSQALAIAQRQQAKSWELRTAISLARFCHSQRRREQAVCAVTETYEWFTEGHQTADLKAAEAILHDHSPAIDRPSRSSSRLP